MDAKARYAFLVLTLMASGFAQAQTAGDLADIQAQTLIATARAKLKKAQEEAEGASAAASGSAGRADTLPVVSGIYGHDGKLYARFLYASGIDYQARAGMTAPGGYMVRQVTDDRVVLTKGGQAYTLGFSDVRPVAPAADAAAGQAGSPPAPFFSAPPLPSPATK
ncbi:type IV pilus biogenesis protein PilP [Xanthomonas campestris pv. mirabilis]|uniref:type IV pilus biogenesis protein PilP n=1 Tax=Xanthomonas euvesicatoria TaxID=456327 RepID=UPI001C46B283|nr:type IV pilus biogenesis protein PilP [Xanthomonas euvesicatoria]MBV6855880.1 type IV pilus biogenesis protein PilP [Xanthomonas campestris pv. mirabilis]